MNKIEVCLFGEKFYIHICPDFLQGLDQGVGHMFQTALLNFPLDFTTLVELSTALASATSDSASRVSKLQGLPRVSNVATGLNQGPNFLSHFNQLC